jgi:hypothetical protein
MKIFLQDPNSWGERVNFVDENNVVLGYDMGQSCCEHADWFIDDTPWQSCYPDDLAPYKKTEGYDGWVFDPSFRLLTQNDGNFDAGGMAIFKIVKEGAEKFVHIFNSHNGYYGHGFEFKDKENLIIESTL